MSCRCSLLLCGPEPIVSTGGGARWQAICHRSMLRDPAVVMCKMNFDKHDWDHIAPEVQNPSIEMQQTVLQSKSVEDEIEELQCRSRCTILRSPVVRTPM